MIDRRLFLTGTVVMLCAQSRALANVTAPGLQPAFVSACRYVDGRYGVVLLSMEGSVVREIPLSARGHDVAVDAQRGRAVAFSRRPGQFAVAFSTTSHAADPVVIEARASRAFAGHGVFSHDGRLLYATETDEQTNDGLLGIYDAGAGYKRIGEMPTHGIDPHEVIFLDDGQTLAVANGGLEMSGRVKLNIMSMEPSLVFIDVRSGDLKARHCLPQSLHQLSIRHIACDGSGRVWFGGQWEGGLLEAPELVGHASADTPLRLIETPAPMGSALRGYIGSVAVSPDKEVLAAAAPKAGRVLFVETSSGKVLSEVALADSCGVAGIAQHGFAISSGYGDLVQKAPFNVEGKRVQLDGIEFDNHMRRVG